MNIDYVYKVEHIVSEGETQNVLLVETNVGGKGLNQSVAATRAGGTVFHAGMIGKEGKILVDFLKKSEVDISLVSLCEKDQGHAVIQVDKQGQEFHTGIWRFQ
jgi:ribokinase